MSFSVSTIVERMGVSLGLSVQLGGSRLYLDLRDPRIEHPGLAMLGFQSPHTGERILVLGPSELGYLAGLTDNIAEQAVRMTCGEEVVALVLPNGKMPPRPVLQGARDADVPVLVCTCDEEVFRHTVQMFIEENTAPRLKKHGVLVDVLGVGILITGPGGIGKSETALDLVLRGYRLVADDIIEITRYRGGQIAGRCAEPIGHHMEIRGLGIINVRELFGAAAVRKLKRIEMIVRLVPWEPLPDGSAPEYDRIGADDRYEEILNQRLPLVELPVSPGRNIASLIEVLARNQVLKQQGLHSARAFAASLAERIASRTDVSALPAQLTRSPARAAGLPRPRPALPTGLNEPTEPAEPMDDLLSFDGSATPFGEPTYTGTPGAGTATAKPASANPATLSDDGGGP
jgi:HPr kinase/phosphorylase